MRYFVHLSVQKGSKLNQLERALPEGLLVDASWLERQGYYRSQRSQYVSAGWLSNSIEEKLKIYL